jgi:hypothetical protein
MRPSIANVLQLHTPTVKTTTPYLCGMMRQVRAFFATEFFDDPPRYLQQQLRPW